LGALNRVLFAPGFLFGEINGYFGEIIPNFGEKSSHFGETAFRFGEIAVITSSYFPAKMKSPESDSELFVS
jgi:hypothetical protein